MKKSFILGTILCLLLVILVGCDDNPSNGITNSLSPPPAPGGLPPMVFVNDILYLPSPMRDAPEMDESWVLVGEVNSYVSGRSPDEHLQTNFGSLYVSGVLVDVIGVARVYHSSNARFRIPLHSEEIFGDHVFEEFYGDSVIIVVNGQHFHYASSVVRDRTNDILSQRIPQLLLVDGVLYERRAHGSGRNLEINDNYVFLGEIESHVMPNEFPTENLQANDNIIGARVYMLQSDNEADYDILVLFNEWFMEYRKFIQ